MRLLLQIVALSFAISLPTGSWAQDADGDGIPDVVETQQGSEPDLKDNDLFGGGARGAELFAMQQYRDFLGREGDAGGTAHWTAQLENGAQSRAQMAETFFGSAEFQATISPVARLYFAYFLRVPDYGGLNYWIAQYRSGNSLEAISNLFAQSAEFNNTYGSLNHSQFVVLVYNNVLGRAPDAAGLAHWTGQLTTGARTRGQVMLAFSESTEYAAFIGNEIYVTMMYFGMLRRAPDAGGFAFWVSYKDQGYSGLALVEGFLQSREYRGRFFPDTDGDGIRDDIGTSIAGQHGAHPGRLRIAREYAQALELLATGTMAASVYNKLAVLSSCAAALNLGQAWTTSADDLVEILALTGFSRRRTLNLLEAFEAGGNATSPVISRDSCPFDPLTGLDVAKVSAALEPVCKPMTIVRFVNGVLTDEGNAEKGVTALERLYLTPTPHSRLGYTKMHNPTAGWHDLLEVFEQKPAENTDRHSNFWRWMASRPPTLSQAYRDFKAKVSDLIVGGLTRTLGDMAGYRSEIQPVVNKFVEEIRVDLENGSNTLLVAHSQGNLFANEVFKELKARKISRARSVRIVAIGTPAESQPDSPSAYTTLGLAPGLPAGPGADLVIATIGKLAAVLPANFWLGAVEVAFGLTTDPTFHFFTGTYLKHHSLRVRIIEQIHQALAELEVEGACTKTTLSVSEPFRPGLVGRFAVKVDPNTTAITAGAAVGSFEVREGNAKLCGGDLDSTGRGTCAYLFPTHGQRVLTATYSGGAPINPAWQPSTSEPTVIDVDAEVIGTHWEAGYSSTVCDAPTSPGYAPNALYGTPINCESGIPYGGGARFHFENGGTKGILFESVGQFAGVKELKALGFDPQVGATLSFSRNASVSMTVFDGNTPRIVEMAGTADYAFTVTAKTAGTLRGTFTVTRPFLAFLGGNVNSPYEIRQARISGGWSANYVNTPFTLPKMNGFDVCLFDNSGINYATGRGPSCDPFYAERFCPGPVAQGCVYAP